MIGLKRHGYPAQRVFQDKHRRRRFQVERGQIALIFARNCVKNSKSNGKKQYRYYSDLPAVTRYTLFNPG